MQTLLRLLVATLLGLALQSSGLVYAEVSWLDGDEGAIWSRPPGFYRDGDHWYAIIHVKPSVTRVRLAGEFTEWDTNPIDLKICHLGSF